MASGYHYWGCLLLLTVLHLSAGFIPYYHPAHGRAAIERWPTAGNLQATGSYHDDAYSRVGNDTTASGLERRRGGSRNGGFSRAHLVRAAAAAFALSPLLPPISPVIKPAEAAVSGGSSMSSLATSVGLLADVLPESVLVESLPLKLDGFRAIGTALNRFNDLRRLQFKRGQSFCSSGEVSLPFEPAELVVDTANVVANSTALEEEQEGPGVSSFRWANFRRIAQDIRSTYDREKDTFRYALTIRANSSTESQDRRRERFASQLKLMDDAINQLGNATASENTTQTLQAQSNCLLHLGHLGELMVAKFPFSPPKTDDRTSDDYYNLPRLFGRAEIELILKVVPKKPEGGGLSLSAPPAPIYKNFTIIVDGFNSPISGGNFVDLCQRGFYLDLPLRFGNVSGSREGNPLNVTIAGTYRGGFVDPIKGKSRRVPLEIMRAEEDGMMPFYGQARNTKLFTRAPPLLSYRTPGAIGFYHPEADGNGANSEFFWLSEDARCQDQQAGTIDGRYTLIGYFVGDQSGLRNLTEDYVVDATNIRWGLDHFVRSRVSFIDILLQGDD